MCHLCVTCEVGYECLLYRMCIFLNVHNIMYEILYLLEYVHNMPFVYNVR